jgi:hypothetical protein
MGPGGRLFEVGIFIAPSVSRRNQSTVINGHTRLDRAWIKYLPL